MANIFEQASRLRIRYSTPQGSLSTDDLWTLPMTSASGNKASLDGIAKGLNQGIQEADVSFVTPSNGPSTALVVAFDIVKHVISVRIADQALLAAEVDRRAKKDSLMAAIVAAENEELTTGTIAELKAKLLAI